MKRSLWTAKLVYDDGALRSGWALLAADGAVQDLGPLAELQERYPGLPLQDKGVYLGPPLVNAHTHLDLGLLPTFKGGFSEFLEYVISNSAARGLAAARQAIPHLGQRVLGSIASNDEALVSWLLSEAELEGVVYWEVLGLLPKQGERELIARTAALLHRWKALEQPGGMRLGLSPHAPYSLTPSLMRATVEMALELGLPLQIHAAESPAEVEYFARRSGPIAEFYDKRGLPADLHPTGLSPIEYLAELGVLDARPTLVHGVQVSENDVRTIAASASTLVSCPRSNVNLQAGLPSYDLYRRHGVTVALGTDSHASAESLDVRDEAYFLLEAGFSEVEVLRMALAGYDALRLPRPGFGKGTPLGQVEFW